MTQRFADRRAVAIGIHDGAGTSGFRHYLAVTHMVGLVPTPLPAGIVEGVVRRVDGGLRIADLAVIPDTTESVPLRDHLSW